MEQILVAVDEHPHAEKVVDYAIALAKNMGAKIILTNAVTRKSIPAGMGDEYRDSKGKVMKEQYYKDVFDRTVSELERRIEKANVPYEGVYGTSDPAKFILNTARSKGTTLIVVGLHGRRRLGRILVLGEVARNVIEASKVPVIVVPQSGSH